MQERDFHIKILNSDETSDDEKIQSIFALMNIADNESLDAIFNIMHNHPCELVRHEAAFSLGETASDRAVKELRKAHVEDNAIVMKHETLMSLGIIGDEDDIPFIEEALNSSIEEISASAQIALERIAQEENIEVTKVNRDENIKKLLNKETSRNDKIHKLNDEKLKKPRKLSDRKFSVLNILRKLYLKIKI